MKKPPRKARPIFFLLARYSPEVRQQLVIKAYAALNSMLSPEATHQHYDTLAMAANVLWGLSKNSEDVWIHNTSDKGSEALKQCRDRVKVKNLSYGLTVAEHQEVLKMLALYDQVISRAGHKDLIEAMATAVHGRDSAAKAGVTRLM